MLTALGLVPAGLYSTVHAAQSSKPGGADARMYIHDAKHGDTLLGLAARYLIRPADWKTLEKLNAIADPRRIPVGTQVKIPVELMRTEFAPATVLRATGKAEVGNAGLAPNTVLKEGDAIRTGENGFVTLKLADGSTMTLQPRSQLVVKTTRQLVNSGGVTDTQLRLENGRLETRVAKQRGSAARYEIDTPTSNMGVRGTIFRVSTDGSSKSQSEVTEGLVAAASVDPKFPGTVDVAAGFGTIVEAGKVPSAPVQLLEPPALKQAEASSEVPDVQIAFGAVPGAVTYRGQAALDGTFTQLVADVTSSGNDIALKDLPDGTLFVRVRGVDAQGLEGRDAQGTRTIKARPFAPALLQPENGSRFAASPAELRWKPAADAKAYRVQLGQSPDQSTGKAAADATGAEFAVSVLDKPAIADTELKVGRALPPGRWTWRVASVDAQGKQGPWSAAHSFDVRPVPMTFTAYPDKNGRVIGIGDEKQKVQVQASRDARFTQVAADRVVDGKIDFAELPVYAYYLRARVADGTGSAGEWSPVWRLEVYPGGWQLIDIAGRTR